MAGARRALAVLGARAVLRALWCVGGMGMVGSAAAQCPLAAGPATLAPPWVAAASPDEAATAYAVGVADLRPAATLDVAREAARVRAMAELAQQIQSDVRSRITESIEKVSSDGRTRVSETFGSATEVQSRLSLRSVQIDQVWLDAAGCRVWVRVRMARAEVERARQAATSDVAAAGVRERLAAAAHAARPLTERLAALAEARELARLADPALTSGYSRDAFDLQQAELAGTLEAQRQRETSYKEAVVRHVQAMAQANTSAAGPARRAAIGRAVAALEAAHSLAPTGVGGYPLPFAPEERLAALYAELAVPCVGRQWFERRNLAVPAALSGAARPACEPAQIARERRTLYMDGKTVQLECTLVLGGVKSAWPKACALLQNSVSADGAVIAAPGAAADLRIALRAEGAVQERKDSEEARAGWRFQGKLRAGAQGAGQLDVADDYEGLTGWNPVSAQMATDLLALSAVRRLEAALNAFWDKR